MRREFHAFFAVDRRRAEYDSYRVDHLGSGTYERIREILKLHKAGMGTTVTVTLPAMSDENH